MRILVFLSLLFVGANAHAAVGGLKLLDYLRARGIKASYTPWRVTRRGEGTAGPNCLTLPLERA